MSHVSTMKHVAKKCWLLEKCVLTGEYALDKSGEIFNENNL